jgi:hypothetical protein
MVDFTQRTLESKSKTARVAPAVHTTQSHDESDTQSEVRRRESARQAVLSDPATHEAVFNSHPLVCNALRIVTKPMQEVYEAVTQIVAHRDPGTCFIGEFRIGKTRGINIVREELGLTFPSLPIGVVNAKHHESPSERTFWGDLLDDYRHGASQSGTAADRRRRLLTLMEAAARSLSSDRYLLFVDEGQNWGETEFTWLRDATNDMLARNVNVITIVFAHPELRSIRERLITRRRTDLIGRFLLTPRTFRGLRDLGELQHTMAAFDNGGLHEYPYGTGISVSEFFLPLAYGHGWRLEGEAPLLNRAFSAIAGRIGRNPDNIGMQWVGAAVRNFFFASYSKDSAAFCGDEAMWMYAAEASGYEASLV